MKYLITLSLVLVTLCACAPYNTIPPDQELFQKQLAFHKELESYILPEKIIRPQDCTSILARNIMSAASEVGEQQGLIVDGRQAKDGKLILGKRIEGRQVLIGLLFNFNKPNDKFSYADITKSNGLDFEACQKMERKYLSALSTRLDRGP